MKFFRMKTPAFLGFTFLLVGLALTLLLVEDRNIFNIGATPSENPQDLRVTNVSDTSFTVSYTTSASVLGTLNFSNNSVSLDNVVLDDRDQLNQTVNKYSVHSITVRDVQAGTTYFFQINSGDKKYINGDSPYSVKTGKPINSEPSGQSPMTGMILDESGKSSAGTLVYLKVNGAQDLSVLTKQDGSYTIPLNNLRKQTLDDYYTLTSDSILSVEAKTNSSSAKASANLNGINPVPPITLSQSYDFSTTQVAATVNNPSQESFPGVGQKVTESPTIEPSVAPTTVIPETPTLMPTITVIPTDSLIADNISPTQIEPQPTIVATGDASVIMIAVVGSILVLFGILLFSTTGRKIPL